MARRRAAARARRRAARALDGASLAELELIPLPAVQLCASRLQLSGGGGGGGAAATALCAQAALAVDERGAYLLGADGILHVHALGVEDRLQLLLDAGEWEESLAAALELYERRAGSAASVGSHGHLQQEAISTRVAQMLLQYVAAALPPPPAPAPEPEACERIGGVCVDFCVSIGRHDMLFGPIAAAFARWPAAERTLLALFEPYMLNGRLTHLSPPLLAAFARHCCAASGPDGAKLRRLEACLLAMDLARMPLPLVLRLCRRLRLHSALAAAHNAAAGDFGAPIAEPSPASPRRRPPTPSARPPPTTATAATTSCRPRCRRRAAPSSRASGTSCSSTSSTASRAARSPPARCRRPSSPRAACRRARTSTTTPTTPPASPPSCASTRPRRSTCSPSPLRTPSPPSPPPPPPPPPRRRPRRRRAARRVAAAAAAKAAAAAAAATAVLEGTPPPPPDAAAAGMPTRPRMLALLEALIMPSVFDGPAAAATFTASQRATSSPFGR